MNAGGQNDTAVEPGGGAESRLLTVWEAAQRARVTRFTVSGWIGSGQLPAVIIDRRRRIRPEDLAAAQANAHVGQVVPTWREDRERAGMRLRALREATGQSQLELAAASGLTHEEISRLELGRLAPLAPTVRALARALEAMPEQFVGYDPVGLSALPVAEAAARLGVPAGRVQTWLRTGALEGVKVSGQWRVPAVVVAELGRSGRLRGNSRRLDPRYRG
jgi:excisionase family DNA binding protein